MHTHTSTHARTHVLREGNELMLSLRPMFYTLTDVTSVYLLQPLGFV